MCYENVLSRGGGAFDGEGEQEGRNVVQDDPHVSEGHTEWVYWEVMGNEVR